MKLDVSKIDLAELNKAWAAGVRDKFDASAKALREAARDFAGFKKGFGDDDKQGFYSRMLNPKSPLNVALLDSVLALADCAGDFAIKRNRRMVATFKSIVSEALEPLRHGVIACCMPPPPGCNDDTWNVFRQWQVKTFDAIGAMQNAIEDTADAETEVEDGIAYEITPGLHAETLRYDIECGLAEMSKRIRKVRASAFGEDVDDAPRMYGRLEATFAALCGGKAEMLEMLKEMRGDMKDVKRDTARLAGERETERERRSAAAKKGHAANRDKVHDDEIAAALAKVHAHAGDDKAKIAHWCDKVIHDDGLQVRGRGGVYKPMTRATLMRYYRTWRKTHGGT